ncbi:hypothetical protein [Bradyrhizobium sp. SSUT77]|uniref:hypothetical protein n=1 Tax=Bradyrhizobium sp. SSUT77 TaxID=3040603 RepID=UPI00244C1C14|nr:hypothetical protein [Bradyrhizobium sp. SSUT77]MDH2346847.1 hypothetical protein [Bradyrhizobium sp. SSUT77]
MRKSKTLSPSSARAVWLAGATLVGAFLGVFSAVGWGDNFRTSTLVVEGLATFYRVALPNDIRELSDIQTAKIAAPSASDYERVGVNNYWIASSENLPVIVGSVPRETVGEIAVVRNHGGELRSALNAFRPGRNFVVYEMENSSHGYCVGGFDVQLNGSTIAGVPMYAPSGPDEVLSMLRLESDKTVRDGFKRVLCSRRVIEIDIGVPHDPSRRLAEFLGLS